MGRGHTHALALACAVVVLLPGAQPAAASDYPVVYNLPAGVALGETVQQTPLGANDWTCKPPAGHPRPVVLVPGLRGDMGWDFQATSPLLANNGYCVFAFDYRSRGHDPLAPVAADLQRFIDRVLAATGAGQVDIVGHSQGGMLPRYNLKFLGAAPKVGTLVGISPINHGVSLGGVSELLAGNDLAVSTVSTVCGACADDGAGSAFMRKLNEGGDTVPGVRYVVIGTRFEQVAWPYESVFLDGPRVKNILLQDQCATDLTDHIASIYDSIALRDMLNALDPAHARPVTCTVVLPGVGG